MDDWTDLSLDGWIDGWMGCRMGGGLVSSRMINK